MWPDSDSSGRFQKQQCVLRLRFLTQCTAVARGEARLPGGDLNSKDNWPLALQTARRKNPCNQNCERGQSPDFCYISCYISCYVHASLSRKNTDNNTILWGDPLDLEKFKFLPVDHPHCCHVSLLHTLLPEIIFFLISTRNRLDVVASRVNRIEICSAF